MAKPTRFFKWLVKLRMWYADIRGHHGKKWNYEPGGIRCRADAYEDGC